ncbi:hypothetical protein Plhal304r1_c038g0115311 [Plasmopara halstedii]
MYNRILIRVSGALMWNFDLWQGVPAPATIVVSVMDAVLILRKLATLCLLLVECKEYERIDQDVALAPTPAMLQLCWP